MSVEAIRNILESMANRPLDNPQGDIAPIVPGVDPAMASEPADDHQRPADQAIGDPAAVPAAEADEVPGEADDDEGTMQESFERHLAKHIPFKLEFESAIVEGSDLDTDLAAKALVAIQEAATRAIAEHTQKLTTAASQIMEQVVTQKIEEMEAKVDAYHDRVVSEWMEENRLAVEQGIRTEIAESFMEEMKSVFEKHFVELPKAKRDLYEEAISKGEEIFTKLTESEVALAALQTELQTVKKSALVESICHGMVATKAAKFRELSEDIQFSDELEGKLKSLAESMTEAAPVEPVTTISNSVTEDVSMVAEAIIEDRREKKMDDQMSRYLSFMDRL